MKKVTIEWLKGIESNLEDISLEDETLTKEEREFLEEALEAVRNLLEGHWE